MTITFIFLKVDYLEVKPFAKMGHQDLSHLKKKKCIGVSIFLNNFQILFSLLPIFLFWLLIHFRMKEKKKYELCVYYKASLLPTYSTREVVDQKEAVAILSSFQRQYIK